MTEPKFIISDGKNYLLVNGDGKITDEVVDVSGLEKISNGKNSCEIEGERRTIFPSVVKYCLDVAREQGVYYVGSVNTRVFRGAIEINGLSMNGQGIRAVVIPEFYSAKRN